MSKLHQVHRLAPRQLAIVAGGALACATSLAAMAGPAQAVSVTQVGSTSVIATEGPNHTLDFYWQPIGSTSWHKEVVAYGWAYSAPSVAQVGKSAEIAVEGLSHSLDFYWQSLGTNTWAPETAAGLFTTYSARRRSPSSATPR